MATPLTSCDAWAELQRLNEDVHARRLRSWLSEPNRFAKCSAMLGPVLCDASRQLVDDRIAEALVDLARQRGVTRFVERVFSGQRVNTTEGRAVLHMALRAAETGSTWRDADGRDVVPDVLAQREAMFQIADETRSGQRLGSTGQAISAVVNIGIGGSHLGPAMVTHALADGTVEVRFVSNVDGTSLERALAGLEPARTLFVIVSKSFSTAETLLNARSAAAWLRESLARSDVSAHFVAVTARPDRAANFGCAAVLESWDWVGGRFSLWGTAGIAIACAIGSLEFGRLLDGARLADEHVRSAAPAHCLPLRLALLDVWNFGVRGAHSRAVVPYDERLALLPAYLQQCEMESNGKSVGLDGVAVDHATGPVVWGAAGTDAQHAFFQLLHQGTQCIPVDFVVAARAGHERAAHHDALLANCLAQSRALAWGRTEDEAAAEMRAHGSFEDEVRVLAAHRTFPGGRPSTTFVIDTLDAFSLGVLVAMYEHSVLFKGALWGIPSFDQWGVELGKSMAGSMEPALRGSEEHALEPATQALVDHIRARR